MNRSSFIRTSWRIWFPLSLILLVVWPILLVMSAFLFDAPGSENSFFTILLAGSGASYGPVWIVTMIASRVLRKRGKTERADQIRWLTLVPVLVWMIAFSVILGWCGGSFVCEL